MSVLLPVHSSFVEWSSYKINGGSVIFTNTNNYYNTQYIETTNLDLSIFTTLNPKYPANIATFYLTVYFSDNTSTILWSDTTTNRIIGYTVPKRVYDLGVVRNVLYLTVTSSYPNIYFELWNQSKSIITINRYLRPVLVSNTHNFNFTYNDTNFPASTIVPDSSLLITNNAPNIYTGNLDWYILSQPFDITRVSSNTVFNNQINGLITYNTTNISTQVAITSNIYINNNIYIIAVNPEGLVGQLSLPTQLMTYPRFTNQGSYFINLTNNTSNNISSIISQASGPIKWNIISTYGSNLRVFNTTINNSNICTLYTKQYINSNNIILTATNLNNNTTSNTLSIIAAYTPTINAPSQILQTITSNYTYTFTNISQPTLNTGPVIWYAQNNINGVTVNYNNGNITVKPYISSNLILKVQNGIGNSTSKTIYINTVATPIFNIPNILNISTNYDSNSYYQLITRDPSTNTRWSIQPQLNGISINNVTGLMTFNPSIYISSNIRLIATNTLGCNISSTTQLNLAATPQIINPGNIRFNMTNSNYNLQLQLASNSIGTGKVSWDIVNNIYNGLTINSNGLLTVTMYNPINSNINILAYNIANGSNISNLRINISQQPTVVNPGNKIINLLPSQSYSLQLNTSNSLLNSNAPYNKFNILNWYINKASTIDTQNILSINSNGLLNVASNSVYNQNVYIGASNLTGQSNETVFNLSVGIIPNFNCPQNLYGSIDAVNYTYNYKFIQFTQGITTWNVIDGITSNSLAPIITITNNGLLQFNGTTIQPTYNYNKSLLITAKNANNFQTIYRTNLNLELQPYIYTPNITETTISTTTNNFTYQLTTNNAPIKLYYLIAPFIQGISINSNTGLVTIQSNIYYGETSFIVGASNNYSGTNTVDFPINIAQKPNLINPINISCNLTTNQQFIYPIINNANGTGQLNWSINGTTSYTIPGLSIGSTGIINLLPNYYVNDIITVSASNNAYIFPYIGINNISTISFDLKVGYTPVMIPPPNNNILVNTEPNKLTTYQLNQITQGTGNMIGSLSNISPFIASNVFIDNTGLITINSNIYINQSNINAKLTNITGGYCNIYFNLFAAQIPQYNLPTIIQVNMSNNANNYTYTLYTTSSNNATSNVNWVIKPSYIPGITTKTINNDYINALEIIYNSNIYLNCNINITATNPFGGCNIQNTQLIYAQVPIINNPYILSYNSNVYQYVNNINYSYNFGINSNTGPLNWTLTPSIPGLSINSSGVLSYTSINALINNITVSATNINNISCNINLPITLTQTPIIVNPVNVNSFMYNNNFTYQMNILNFTQCGIVTWSLTPSINNLSINSKTGIITFLKDNLINSNITVYGTNSNNITSSATFKLTVSVNPSIVVPNNINVSLYPNTLLTSNVYQSNINTGPIIWSLTDTNYNIINGVSISNISTQLAQIKVTSNIYINQPIIVSASNIYGAISSKIINMTVAQIPVLINPVNISCNLSSHIPFNYKVSNLAITSQPYTWYTNNKNINIDSNGLITVPPHIGINSNITIVASNILGVSCNITFNLTVTDIPSIITTIPSSSVNFFDTYNYQLINTNLRASYTPFTWSFSNTYFSGLSINNNTGLLTLESAYSLNNVNVNISASNILGYVNTNTINMNILRSPSIIKPPSIASNISSGFSYQMLRQSESNGILPTTWYIVNTPKPQGLNIDSNSGLLIFNQLYNINQTVYIGASNSLGGCNIVPFNLNLSPSAYLSNINIIDISSNSVILNWGGNYVSNVNIYAITSNTIYNSSISNIPYINSPYNYSLLYPNTGYTFIITPYNSLQQNGNVYTVSNIITLPSQLTNINTVISPYSCILNWSNIYQNAYTQVSWSNLLNITTSNSQKIINTSNYIITNLTPNTRYNIILNTYNYSNISGTYSLIPITTYASVNTSVINVTTNSATINWITDSSNNYYNYPSYSNININIFGSNNNYIYNSNLGFVFNSNILYTLNNLNQSVLYNINTIVYNTNNTSNIYNTLFSTTGFLPKLIVTEPSKNLFNISWLTGKYDHVKYMYNNSDGSTTSNIMYDTSVSLSITSYYVLKFTVIPYNNLNIPGQPSSVYIQNTVDSAVIYYE